MKNKKGTSKTKTLTLILFFLLVPFAFAQTQSMAVIYKNEACGHCSMYLSELKSILEQKGFAVTEKSMINDLAARNEWTQFHAQKNIPVEMQGHLLVLLNNSLALEGHVPTRLVKQLIEKYPNPYNGFLLIYQDLMIEEELLESYKVLSSGKIYEYGIEKNVSDWTDLAQQNTQTPLPLAGLVGLSGLLAGIHPCTISVLLLFLAFLFTLRSDRLTTLKIGAGYIAGVFAAYFLIGIGILQAFSFTTPHFAAKAAGALILLLGFYNLLRLLGARVPSLSVTGKTKPQIVELVKKNSFFASLAAGILVGVCSFGCTAGIYFSVLGILAANPAQGTALLLLYNFMFVLPLIVVLFAVTQKNVAEKIQKLQQENNRLVQLTATLFMLLAGAWLLVVV